MSIFKPSRSFCPKCLNTIRWYDNIPVLSFILLGGRCRFCRCRISLRYPFVEILTGALLALLFYYFFYAVPDLTILQSLLLFLLYSYVICGMIVVTFVDIDFRIIPDEITLTGIPLVILFSALFPYKIHGEWLLQVRIPGEPYITGLLTAGLGAFIGGGILWSVGVIGKILLKKEAMGFGDVKYLAMIGGLLGWQGVGYTLFLGCLSGTVFGIPYYAITKDRYIPFGPFLSLGAILVIFLRPHIIMLTKQYLQLITSS
jgi:leader peptidase (prepilin peptidase)/N-methyltransferase